MFTAPKIRKANGFAPVILVVAGAIVLVIIVLAATGVIKGNFSVTRNKGESQPQEEQASVQTEPESQPTQPAKGPEVSETYTNENLNFQISHPKDWKPG